MPNIQFNQPMAFEERQLTDGMRSMIRKRVNSGFRSPWLIFGLSMGLIAPVIIYFNFRTIPVLQSAAAIVGYCLIGYLILCIIIIFLQVRSRRKKRRLYETVLLYGTYDKVEVLEKRINLNIRLNKIPQQIIRLKHNHDIIELKTFDLNYSSFFNPGFINVLTHLKAPGIFIPENSWVAYEKDDTKIDGSYSV